MQTPAEVAAKYGDKTKIATAVQQNIVNPTVGMLAGMVIDRIRAPQPQAPQSTVAQKVMAGLGATPQAQQMGMQPPAATPAQSPAVPARTMNAASGGLMDLPVDDSMFDYAGGGVVAFAGGSPGTMIPRFEDLPLAGGDATVPGNQFSQFFSSIGGTERRIDPVTGEAVTLGEYLRRVDQRKARAAAPAAQSQAAAALTAQPPAQGPAAPPVAPPAAAPQAAAQAAPKTETKPAAPAPFQLPTAETPEAYKERMKAFGINDDAAKKIEASLQKLGGSAEDKERAIAMAFIRAGMGTAAGKSPNALLNFAEGTLGGIEQYSKDTKDIRTAERDTEKIRIEVAKAEDAKQRGDFKAYNEHINRANDLAVKLEGLNLETRRTVAAEKQAGAYAEALKKPSEEQLRQSFFARDPAGYQRYQAASRPGFESVQNQRLNIALKSITDTLATMSRNDPQRKVLEEERRRLLNLLGSSGAEMPPDIQAIVNQYSGGPAQPPR